MTKKKNKNKVQNQQNRQTGTANLGVVQQSIELTQSITIGNNEQTHRGADGGTDIITSISTETSIVLPNIVHKVNQLQDKGVLKLEKESSFTKDTSFEKANAQISKQEEIQQIVFGEKTENVNESSPSSRHQVDQRHLFQPVKQDQQMSQVRQNPGLEKKSQQKEKLEQTFQRTSSGLQICKPQYVFTQEKQEQSILNPVRQEPRVFQSAQSSNQQVKAQSIVQPERQRPSQKIVPIQEGKTQPVLSSGYLVQRTPSGSQGKSQQIFQQEKQVKITQAIDQPKLDSIKPDSIVQTYKQEKPQQIKSEQPTLCSSRYQGQSQPIVHSGQGVRQPVRPQQIVPQERPEQNIVKNDQSVKQQTLIDDKSQSRLQQIMLSTTQTASQPKLVWGKPVQPKLQVQSETAECGDFPLSSEIKNMAITSTKDQQKTSVSPSHSSKELSQPSSRNSPKKAHYARLNVNFKISPTNQQKFLPGRPDDGGKKGRVIQLIINCLNVKINPMKIFMYDIDLTKAEVVGVDQKKRDITSKVKKKECLKELLADFLKGKEGLAVFDGGRIIFNNKLLPYPDGINKITHNFQLESEVVICYFTLQRVSEEDIELENLNNYVNSRKGRSDDMPQEALRALDTIIKEMFLNKNLISIGKRAIFDPKTQMPLICGPYILMDGYSPTIRPHMWNIRFNFDKTQVVCHKPINLLDYIGKMVDINRGFNPSSMTKKLKTLRVRADHLKNLDGKTYIRKYTIFGFSKKSAREEKIVEKDQTIEQYFLKEYKIKLKRPDLPMVKTSPSKNTFIPVELLTMLPFQRLVENDQRVIQEVIRHATIPCFERLDKLKKAVENLQLDSRVDRYMRNYMIQINPKLINVSGRVLDGPDAVFGGQKKELLRGGKWDLRNKTFLKPYDKIVNWALFAVGTENDYQKNEQPLFDVEDTFARSAKRVGINMAANFHFQYVACQQIEAVALDVIGRSAKENKKLDLLVFIVNSDDDYRCVKRFGDMSYGIPTQCMKFFNLQKQKSLDQYLGNIMMKINGKLGGTNWELSAIKNCLFTPIKESFMVFGIDVTHPASNRNDLSKSVAAMVGSLDNNASIYSAIIRQQISKRDKSVVEELLEMEDMVYGLLMKFYVANKTLKPRHLIFYRDGVSEGQFEIVFQREIIAIQNACMKLDKNYQPPMTYIVVQKRHKIRLFPQNEKDGVGKSANVPAGTIVDKDITHCREFDFYLCSHEGIQGTSKPAHYHVLFDENNWGSDDLQSFTFFLCHVYARCARSVSYPAPTYYAHLAAFRGRTLIGQSDDDNSSTASGHSQKTDSSDSQILINEFHNNKLFFI